MTWWGSPRASWTVLQKDGPNHLGLWCSVLPEHQMALITSWLVQVPAIAGGRVEKPPTSEYSLISHEEE